MMGMEPCVKASQLDRLTYLVTRLLLRLVRVRNVAELFWW